MAGANILHLLVSSLPVLESRPHSRDIRPTGASLDKHLAPSRPEAGVLDVNRSRPPAPASKRDFLVINNLQQCVIFLASTQHSTQTHDYYQYNSTISTLSSCQY